MRRRKETLKRLQRYIACLEKKKPHSSSHSVLLQDEPALKWAGGWCTSGIEVEILDPLYAGAKGTVLELLNDDEAVVLMHGLNDVYTFEISKLKVQPPKTGAA